MVTKVAKHPARLPAEDRKSIILDCARSLLSESGYINFQPSTVAERCGISEGTVYRYFPSKRDLLVQVAENWLEDILSIRPDVSNLPDTFTRLQHVIEHSLALARRDPELTRFVLLVLRSDPNYRSSRIYELNRRYTSYVMNVVHEAIDAGALRSDLSPTLVRDMIFGAIEHRIWTFLRGEEGFSLAEAADGITDILYRGLCSTPPISAEAMGGSLGRLERAAATIDRELTQLRHVIGSSDVNTMDRSQKPRMNEGKP